LQTVIESAQNRYLKLFRSLEKRKARTESGLMALEGVRLVSDALLRGCIPEVVLLRADHSMYDFPFLQSLSTPAVIVTVEKTLFDRTAFTESPQGIMAVVKKPVHTLDDIFVLTPQLILIVDGVQEPGNLGTMLRSAAAVGAGGTVLLPGSVDVANPKVLRAAMGANFAIPVAEAGHNELLKELRSRNITLVTTGSEANVGYDSYDWTQPVAVVIGNEGTGVSEPLKAAAGTTVSIPMAYSVESLNAAVAMSVIFFEAARQRRRE
jgi:TrmH family RNA methyltransferase